MLIDELQLDLVEGKWISYTKENFKEINSVAESIIKWVPNCVGICYAFNSSMRLVFSD